jgi:hypothetical protein
MKLFTLLGKFQTNTAFENKRISEVIRCRYMMMVSGWLEHEEEERKCLEMMSGVGTVRISTNDGVVVVRVESWVCVEKKTSVVEVSGG